MPQERQWQKGIMRRERKLFVLNHNFDWEMAQLVSMWLKVFISH
jgi:hypothetical protein